MIAGRQYWILIWYGILLLGVLGLWPSFYWGRKIHWKNLDEFLRALGTVLVSMGMLLMLYQTWVIVARPLLLAALATFVAAFIVGRRLRAERARVGRPSGAFSVPNPLNLPAAPTNAAEVPSAPPREVHPGQERAPGAA
jgi:hypothetical protein